MSIPPVPINPENAPGTPSDEVLLKMARTWVYERMALLSAVIWAGGAAILMATIVPYIPHPQSYIAIASTIPLVPAALPWLFYSRLSRARMHWVERQATAKTAT